MPRAPGGPRAAMAEMGYMRGGCCEAASKGLLSRQGTSAAAGFGSSSLLPAAVQLGTQESGMQKADGAEDAVEVRSRSHGIQGRNVIVKLKAGLSAKVVLSAAWGLATVTGQQVDAHVRAPAQADNHGQNWNGLCGLHVMATSAGLLRLLQRCRFHKAQQECQAASRHRQSHAPHSHCAWVPGWPTSSSCWLLENWRCHPRILATSRW